MNYFEAATARAIQRHGSFVTYTAVTPGVYNPATDSVVNTESSSQVRAYKKQLVANQFNFPNLIGKELAEFYILGSALVSNPKIGDKIVLGTDKFNVVSFKEHSAGMSICLYCLVCNKV